MSRRYGKQVTIVEGINSNDIDLDDLAKKLKTACASGGSAPPPFLITAAIASTMPSIAGSSSGAG